MMNITNTINNNNCIVSEKQLICNSQKYALAVHKNDNLNNLVFFLNKNNFSRCVLKVENYNKTSEENIVLFALTLLECDFVMEVKSYELSFAYAIPLKADKHLRDFVKNNLGLCLSNHQLVFLPSDTLYLYEMIPEGGLKKILHDERKTIKKNSGTQIKKIPFSNTFFDFWKEYDWLRFGEMQSIDFQNFFKLVYNDEHFQLYEYSVNDNIVAYNVCYFSDTSKIIYDVLFPWKNLEFVHRIGIYSMLINLQHAFDLGWGYSICYGIYEYKNTILNKLNGD